MKKLLYLVPLILIVLSALPVSLYKDKVNFLLYENPNAKVDNLEDALKKLSPSHWKMQDYKVNASINPGLDSLPLESSEIDALLDQQASEAPKPEPLYKDATFRGFPFGAYFSKSSSTGTVNNQASYSASGYSWLWAAADVSLVIASVAIAFAVNRKK